MLVGVPTLGLFLLSLIGSPLFANMSATRTHCPPTQTANVRTVLAGLEHADCAHTGLGPCLGATGCVTLPVALHSGTPSIVPVSLMTLAAVYEILPHTLFRSSPPTPPPDLI